MFTIKILSSVIIGSHRRERVGQEYGSFRTPLGKHIIRAKIGEGQPVNTVFVRRRPTGEIYTPDLGTRFPGRDWILTGFCGYRAVSPDSIAWERWIPCAGTFIFMAAPIA